MKREIRLFKQVLFFTLFLLIQLFVYAQRPEPDIYELNFNELAKLKVVSVSKTEQTLTEIPTTVRVISGNEIEEKGYFTFEELLSDLPGFQFRNIQSINSYVFQRGIPNQNNLILVLIDGIQVNELNSGGFYGGAQYDLASIERVEVVYGPSSVGYGTNAISGIINIITKDARKNSAGVSGLAGNFKTHGSHAYYNHVNENNSFRFRVSGMVKSTDRANLKGENGDYNWTDLLDNFENDYNFGIKASYKNIMFGTNYLNKQSSLGTYQKSAGTVYKDFGTLWNIQFLNNYLKYQMQLSDKIRWSSVLYNRNATVMKNSVYQVTDTAQVGYYRPNNLTGFENLLDLKLGTNISVTGGLVIEYEKLAESAVLTYSNSMTEAPPIPGSPKFQKNYLTSVYFEPRIHLVKYLFLSGGVRFDYSTVYNRVLTPRVGLNFNLDKLSALISYAEAFRAPKPWDYYDGVGNSSLLPETMKSVEMAMKYQIASKWSSNLSVYRNILQNGIAKEYIEQSYRWANIGTINTTGAECTLQHSSQRLKTEVNYTYTNSTDENRNNLTEISNHTANASFTYVIQKKLKINLRTNYVSKRKNPVLITTTQSNFVDPFVIVNGAITWNPVAPVTVQFIGRNLLNSEYYHTSNRSPDRYRQAQRTVMLSVAYHFEK